MKNIATFVLIIIFVFSSLTFGFLLGSYFLENGDNTKSDQENLAVSYPQDTPVSFPTQEQANSGNEGSMEKYIFITDDNILKINYKNEIITVSLSRKNWDQIKFSPAGDTFAVLSNTDDIYDIFIYFIDSREWRQFTYYADKEQSGVSSYLWLDDNNILFTQGEENNVWLHNLDINSSEILKLSRVNGLLIDINNNKNRLLLQKNNGKFFITTNDGVFMYELQKSNIDKAFFTSDENLIFVNYRSNDKNSVGYMFLGSQEINPIENLKNTKIFCNNYDFAIGFDYDSRKFLNIDLKTKINTQIINFDDVQKANCSFNQNKIYVMNSDKKWFLIDMLSSQVTELVEFSGYINIFPY